MAEAANVNVTLEGLREQFNPFAQARTALESTSSVAPSSQTWRREPALDDRMVNADQYDASDHTLVVTSSKARCAAACGELQTCQSFFFSKRSGHCHLHADVFWGDSDSTEEGGVRYYTASSEEEEEERPLKTSKNKILTCSRHCRVPKDSKFKYVSDTVYEYSYKMETATHTSRSSHHATHIVIEAVAQVHVISTCDMVLKLREVRIMESDSTPDKPLRKSDNSKRFRSELEKESLRFAFLDAVYKRVGLEYRPVHATKDEDETAAEIALRAVREVLRQLCTHSEVLPETTDLFFDLVVNVRKLSAPSLRVMYERVSGNSICSESLRVKKFFLDALAMAGTESTVRLLTKALTSHSNKKGSLNTHSLIATLAFLPNTTSPMLKAANTLLDHEILAHSAMLPVSSMVNNYCEKHDDCNTNPDVQRIMQHFRRVIGVQCYANNNNAETVLLGLRAIGNAGHVTRMTEVLENCLKRENNPLNIRVAAAEAFRRNISSDRLGFNTNLIWASSASSVSWVPRSLTTNLVLNFLGKNLDLAEVGVRGEGLEFFVEHALLPLFGRKRPSIGPKKRQENLDSLNSSIFARILGNEVTFHQLTGSGSLLKQMTAGKFFDVKDFLAKISTKGAASYSQSLVLLDQRVTVPTSCGLPLTVAVNSTVTAQLNVSGKLDLARAFSRPRVLHVDGVIQPSAALKITGTMTMDAIVTRTALRMTGTLYSSTVLKGRVQLDRGKLFDMQLDVPKDKMTMFEARTDISFVHRNKEYPVTLTSESRRDLTACTGSRGVTLFGLDLCGAIQLPDSTSSALMYDLISQQSSLSVVLHKRDSLTQYRVLARQSMTKNGASAHLSFSTPGSDTDRTFELYLNADLKHLKVDMRAFSPWKKVDLSGSITNTRTAKGARCVLIVDNKVIYGVISEVKVTKTKAGLTYTPVLELRRIGSKPVTFTGSVTFGRFGKNVGLDFTLSGVSEFTPNVKDAMVKTPTRTQTHYRLDARVKSSVAKVSMDARADVKAGQMLMTRLTLDHDIPSLLPKDTISMKMDLKVSHKHSPTFLESRMSVNYGDNQQTRGRLVLINKSSRFIRIVGKASVYLPDSPRRMRRNTKRSTPRKKLPYIQINMKLNENDDEYDLNTGAHFGRKKRDFSSTLNVKKPVSLRRIEMHCKGIPYSRKYLEFEAEFAHSMHPLLADVLDALFAKQWTELDISKPLRLLSSVPGATALEKDRKRNQEVSNFEEHLPTDAMYTSEHIEQMISAIEIGITSDEAEEVRITDSMDIKGGVDFSSSFVDLVTGSLKVAHSYDGDLHESDVKLNKNEEEYKVQMRVQDNIAKWLQRNKGKISVSAPEKLHSAEWKHNIDGTRLRSTFMSTWSTSRQVFIDLSGRMESTNRSNELYGDVIFQSPWKPIRDWRVSVGHDASPGLFRSKSTVRQAGLKKTSHQILFMHTSSSTDASVTVFSPWTKKVSASLISRHEIYPVTGTAELTWNPRQKLTLTTTASLEAWDDAEVSANVKTTIPGIKLMSAEVSNRMYGEDLVSKATAKYGESNTFGVESTLQRKDWRKLRLRVLTPVTDFRILETGFRIDGGVRNLSSSADFRIYPIVKKYDTTLEWTYGEDFTGKFLLATPLDVVSNVQINAFSKVSGKYRHSGAIMKVHPAQLYSVDMKHTVSTLQQFSMTLKTPLEKYEKFEIEISQKKTDTSMSEVAVNIYFPQEQTVTVLGYLDLDKQLGGNFSVNSSVTGLKSSNVTFIIWEHGSQILGEMNITTNDRESFATVLLMLDDSESVPFASSEFLAHDVKIVKRLVSALKHMDSLQKMKLQFQSGLDKRMPDTGGMDILSHDFDTDLSVSCDRNSEFIANRFQLVSQFYEDILFLSNYTHNSENMLMSLSAAHGTTFSFNGNVTLSPSKLEPYSIQNPHWLKDSEKMAQLHSYINYPALVVMVGDLFGDLNGGKVHFETKTPFSGFSHFGGYARVHKSSASDENETGDGSGGDDNGKIDHPVLSVSDISVHTLSLLGWTKQPDNDFNRVSFDLEHLASQNVCKTQLQLTSNLTESNTTFLLVLGLGTVKHLIAIATAESTKRPDFKMAVNHLHSVGMLNSSIIVETENTGNISVVAAYTRDQHNLTTNASVRLGSNFYFQSMYGDNVNDVGVRKIRSASGFLSPSTGSVRTSAELGFDANDPWKNNISAFIDTQVKDRSMSVNFTLSQDSHVGFRGHFLRESEATSHSSNNDIAEVKLAYHGIPSDFKSSILIDRVNCEPCEGAMEMKRTSVYDMKTAIALKSPLHYAKDLSLTIQNHGNSQGEHRGLLSFGWAPYRKISVDANSKHLPSLVGVTHATDVVIVTPFQEFQTGSVKIRHNRILAKTDSVLEAKVNAQTVLNAEFSSSLVQSSLGVTKPLLSFFKLSAIGFSPKESSHHANLFVHWNLSNPDSNVRIQTRVRMNVDRDDESKDRDYSVKIIHPKRLVAWKYLSHTTSSTSSGEGELAWDQSELNDNDKKVYYSYSTLREKTFSTCSYKGEFKVGTPVRSLEAKGSLVRGAETETYLEGDQKFMKTEAVFYWDAERDRNKQVTLTSSVTQGEQKAADLMLTLPSISQNFRLKSDLILLRNTTIWDASTSFSYSPDPSKTFSFTSTLFNATNPSGGSTLTMTTSLTQPSSDLDIGLASEISGSDAIYGSSLGAWYLTSGEEMKTGHFSGVFHHMTRKLTAKAKTQSSELSLEAELPHGETRQLNLQGYVHDLQDQARNKQLSIRTVLDPLHRSFLINMDSDTENPNSFAALEAWYVNDSAIRAEAYRNHVTGSETDGVLALRLNASTMLHARLAWRPQLAHEMELLSENLKLRFDDFKQQTELTLRASRYTVQNEITAKMTSVMTMMINDVTPLLALWEMELKVVNKQLEEVLRDIDTYYTAHAEFFEDLQQPLKDSAELLVDQLSSVYRLTLNKTTGLADSLAQIVVDSELLQYTHNAFGQLSRKLAMAEAEGSKKLHDVLEVIDLYLMLVKDRMVEVTNTISAFDSLDSYLDVARSQLGSLQTSRDQLTSWLSPLSTSSPVVALASSAKELYNQGIWAYHYLHLSAPSHDRLDSITDSLRDIIMAEIRFRLRHFRFLQRSRITVWLPERGEIQAEICLPFPVRSLILTRPDLQKLWEDAQNNSQKLHHRRMRIQYKPLE
ncbi:uncharacterized protein [Littorina saxatilis]|uniref:uncharacterized protein n=1 Tax=Littorina saxatilis TaxID=31220 RepID=UPI0038B67D8F